MAKRTDADYEIEPLTNGLLVLEALEGIGFEPVSIDTIVGRTGLPKHKVYWYLRTLRLRGYVVQTADKKKWAVGARISKFAGRYSDLALRALT